MVNWSVVCETNDARVKEIDEADNRNELEVGCIEVSRIPS